jgi:hypothetical protein
MDATSRRVIGTTITILLANSATFHDRRDRIGGQGKDLRAQINAGGKETSEQLAQLHERMTKLEGLRRAQGEAVTGKRAAER